MSLSLTKPSVGSTDWGTSVNQNWTDIENAVNNSTPAGAIGMFGGSAIPTGYLECDGSAVSRTTYAALFSAIGTTWGAGDGSTTFNLPDLRGRAPIGAGQGSGLTNRTLGATGGAETHTLATGEIPSHTHGLSAGSAVIVTGAGGSWQNQGGSDGSGASISNAGGGGSHNNMQPYGVVKFMIKT